MLLWYSQYRQYYLGLGKDHDPIPILTRQWEHKSLENWKLSPFFRNQQWAFQYVVLRGGTY